MFARRRSVDQTSGGVPIDPDAPQPAPAQTGITGPAAKLMQMLGLSPEMLNQTASEVAAMLKDFRDRLDRIEAKVDRLNNIVDRGWQENATDPSRARVAIKEAEKRNGTG